MRHSHGPLRSVQTERERWTYACTHTHTNEHTKTAKETEWHTWKHKHMCAHKQGQWSLSWCGPKQPNALPWHTRTRTHTHLHTLKSHLQLEIQPTERLYCWHSETDRERRIRKEGRNGRDRVNQEIRRKEREEEGWKETEEVTDRSGGEKYGTKLLPSAHSNQKLLHQLLLRSQPLLEFIHYWIKCHWMYCVPPPPTK